MKLGLISDTHGQVPNAVHTALAGVDYILHAGDVGPMDVITELEAIAPVHAVLGNTDYGITLPVTRLEELGGRTILIHHIVDVDFPSQTVRELLSTEKPEIVVFGHTHMPFDELRSRIRFINPGSASQPRGGTAPRWQSWNFPAKHPRCSRLHWRNPERMLACAFFDPPFVA